MSLKIEKIKLTDKIIREICSEIMNDYVYIDTTNHKKVSIQYNDEEGLGVINIYLVPFVESKWCGHTHDVVGFKPIKIEYWDKSKDNIIEYKPQKKLKQKDK